MKMSPHNPIRQINIPKELGFLCPVAIDDLVRIGNMNDGGYVIPKSVIGNTEHLLSFGLSEDWTFEEHFLSLNANLKIHAYDHTVSEKLFKKKLAKTVKRLFYFRSTISDLTLRIAILKSYRKFFQGGNKHFVERIHNRKDHPNDATIETVFSRIDSNKIFVKMDIEGSEYRVIESLLKHSGKIIGMAIEFHDTDPLRVIFSSSVQKIKESYEIVHIHANNCSPLADDSIPEVFEITFYRKDLCKSSGLRTQLPLENLDAPNNPNAAEYGLSFSVNS